MQSRSKLDNICSCRRQPCIAACMLSAADQMQMLLSCCLSAYTSILQTAVLLVMAGLPLCPMPC